MEQKTNRIFYNVAMILIVLLVVVQIVDLAPNNILLSTLLQDTLTRLFAGGIFVMMLYSMEHRVFHLKNKRVIYSLFILVPGLIIAINNFPISAFLNGRTDFTEPLYYVGLFLIECFTVGFFEEILFRYVVLVLLLQRLPNKQKGTLYAIVLSSLVFGLIHGANLLYGAGLGNTILQMGYSFLMGMLWAVVFLRTRNIIYPIILHSLYNFFGQLMFRFGTVELRYDVATIIVTTVLALFAIYYYFNEFKKIKMRDIKDLTLR